MRRGIAPEVWLEVMRGSGLRDFTRVGTPESLAAEAARLESRWLKGQRAARRLFPLAA